MMVEWFGAKTIYRTHLSGPATRPVDDAEHAAPACGEPAEWDGHEASSMCVTMVEECIVLIRADNPDGALEKAEQEARAYAAGKSFNVHGQGLVRRFLEHVEVFHMFHGPSDGAEIFSRTYVDSGARTDDEVVDEASPTDGTRAALRKLFVPDIAETVRRNEGGQAGD